MRTRMFGQFALLVWAAMHVAGQAPPQSGVVSAGTGNPYARASQLPARILSFTAKPESIQPGQPVTLQWSTENQGGSSIEPGVGVITARGSRVVSPSATTTYTLTVRGPNNQVLTKELTVTVAGTKPVTATASAAAQEIPKMPDGKPNLRACTTRFFRGPSSLEVRR